MKLVHKYPILGSSENPNNLSLTVKSILLALIPLFVYVGRINGLELVEADLVQLINAVATIVASVGFIFGMVRKIKNN